MDKRVDSVAERISAVVDSAACGLRNVGTGLVYRNPMTQLRSRHAYFPSMAQLSDGTLVCGMDLGSAFEAIDVRSYISRSVDEGETWSEPEIVFEPDEAKHRVSTSCRINTPGHGDELIGWAALFDRSDTELGLLNPATNGFVDVDFAVVRSGDGGQTWSKPQIIDLPVPWPNYEICYPPFPLGEGRMIVPASPWSTWGGEKPASPNGLAWLSHDNGQTWPDSTHTFTDAVDGLKAFEQKFTRLSDGRLIVMAWSFDEKKNANRPNRFSISSNQGRTFSTPIYTQLPGETCTILGLEDNHLLCVYRRCDDKPGLWGHIARIDGDKWVPLADERLWSGCGYGQEANDDGYQAMAQLRFGCPSVIRLAEGGVMIVFWAVEDGVSNIRWIKVKADF